ncbi:MAG TPA: hypothetical protein VGO56_09510 [Pyrinomonadaceae bacterium]|jgi:hypothetical protein|nr:hypothetical protein [Pyrinomonadaceae bacterium]
MRKDRKTTRNLAAQTKNQQSTSENIEPDDLSTAGKQKKKSAVSTSRRSFMGKATAAALTASLLGGRKPNLTFAQGEGEKTLSCITGCDIEDLTPTGRANTQLAKRIVAAIFDRSMGVPPHPCNNDETLYKNQNYIGNFTKGLRKINNFGEVDPVAYCALLKAIKTNSPGDFEAIPLGCAPCVSDERADNFMNDDNFRTAQGIVPDPRPYSSSSDGSQLSASEQSRIYDGTVNTPAQDLADQQEADYDQANSVPNESQARLGISPNTPPVQRRLTNPQSGLSHQLENIGVTQLAAPPAPTLASADTAAEMVELYWQSLVRDVPFINWSTDTNIAAAISDLNARFKFYAGLPQYEIVAPGVTPRLEPRGFPTQPFTPLGQIPGVGNSITLQTLFRGFTKTDALGPFISQFLIKDAPYGPQTVPAKIQPAVAQDYMMNPTSWLNVQKGCMPSPLQLLPTPRYISNGRDLDRYIEFCYVTQPYNNAFGLLLQVPDAQRNDGGGYGIAFDPKDPYNHSCTQEGFVTFGPSHILSMIQKAAFAAHTHTWHEKWFVHRRLRPEEYGGWVNFDFRNERDYPINSVLGTSTVIPKIATKTGGYYFLPQAFPEGSPIHPSYTAGHATAAGACVTILKAFFNDQALIPNPKQPNASGSALVPYTGSDANQLTVGTELNKLASNIGFGRCFAGVHWRSDNTASILRGEDVAISLLEDYGFTYNENFQGFSFIDFRGKKRTGIGKRR